MNGTVNDFSKVLLVVFICCLFYSCDVFSDVRNEIIFIGTSLFVAEKFATILLAARVISAVSVCCKFSSDLSSCRSSLLIQLFISFFHSNLVALISVMLRASS